MTSAFSSGCERRVSRVLVAPDNIELSSTEASPALSVTVFDTNDEEIHEFQVVWTSSDPSVVVVDQDGYLSAKGTGQALVTASVDNVEQDVSVEVVLCSSLKTDKSDIALTIGESFPVNVQSFDEKNNPISCPLIWRVEDMGIARVDEKGDIVGVAPGQTTVTVLTGTKSATMNVNVTAVSNPMAKTVEIITRDPESEIEAQADMREAEELLRERQEEEYTPPQEEEDEEDNEE